MNLSRAWLTWTDGRQAASVDRLRAGIEGSGGGGQAKIAMSRHGRGFGFRGRTDGRAIRPWRLVHINITFTQSADGRIGPTCAYGDWQVACTAVAAVVRDLASLTVVRTLHVAGAPGRSVAVLAAFCSHIHQHTLCFRITWRVSSFYTDADFKINKTFQTTKIISLQNLTLPAFLNLYKSW